VDTVRSHVRGSTLSIGRPTPKNNVYALNERGNPLPIGQVGVMWAGGAGISRGYLNLPDESGECYRVDPFVGNGYVSSFAFDNLLTNLTCYQVLHVQHWQSWPLAP
jgi:non-ribosomal peptide synthetase component F